MEFFACGWKVGAHFIMFLFSLLKRQSSAICSRAEISFLPPCRAISTEKVIPLWQKTLSITAVVISIW
jgi:hypothetical protein